MLFATLMLLLVAAAAAGSVLHASEPWLVAPDSSKQLVLDSRVIQSTEHARLTLGTVAKDAHNPLFHADQAWENALNNLYPNVLWDEGERRFKLWYKCVLTDKEVIAQMADPATIHDQGWFLLYATSTDGLTWEKPALGQFGFAGSTANNVVARDTPNAGVFRDPHDSDPARRFKMVYDVGLGKLRTRTSPDGIRWSQPQEPRGFAGFNGDTHNNAFWDERTGRYLWYTRAYLGERLVACFESVDFANWEPVGVVLRSSLAEGRAHQTYCMPVFPYANGYLGFVMMYHLGAGRTVDCELAWSPDSVTWTRIAPGTPFIPRGPKGSCDGACIYAPSGPAIVQDGKLLIFYGGDFAPHQGWKRHCLPCLARVRMDGFAAYEPDAPGSVAILVTLPQMVTGPLQISADARGGAVRVSVLDDPAFGSEPGTPVVENVTDGNLHWPGRNPASLVGKIVRLRFELRDARLYAFRGTQLVPAPVPTTGIRRFFQEMEVGLNPAQPADGSRIRFTLDGSEPTVHSPEWRLPLQLNKTTRLRARLFPPGASQGGAELDQIFTLLDSRHRPLPGATGKTFTFDESVSGWQALDRLERRSQSGAKGGYIEVSRAGGLRPFAFLAGNSPDGLAGDWSRRFDGEGADIAFHTRCSAEGGSYQLELFAEDVAAWSYAGFPKFTKDWQRAVVPLRWDWNDAEAEAAGWVRGRAAFSWGETIRHVGKVVVAAGTGAGPGFDLDEFGVVPFGD